MISLEPPGGPAATTLPQDEAEAWQAAGLSRSGLTRFLRVAKGAVGVAGEVDVLLTGDRTSRRLNRTYRGKNKATDVLSFPAPAELAGVHAGDLAISLETAARQAAEHGHSLRDEVRVLLLHGLLHLRGLDHESDRGEMAAREADLRRALRLPAGLIARTQREGSPRRRAESPKQARNQDRKQDRKQVGAGR